MNWTELLSAEIRPTYRTTEKLVASVDNGALEWKPATGTNWMTTGSASQAPHRILRRCFPGLHYRGSAPAPWDPTEMLLGHRLLQMVDHLKQHKAQLFYYLKPQGKPVNTAELWGM